MKKSIHEDVKKVIMKKFEYVDEWKRGGSIHKISIPRRNSRINDKAFH